MSCPPSPSQVEEWSLVLVREYLAKRGYRQTLDTLHSELPSKPPPTTSSAVAASLQLSSLHAQNQKKTLPYNFATLLELWIHDTLSKRSTAPPSSTSTSFQSDDVRSSLVRAPSRPQQPAQPPPAAAIKNTQKFMPSSPPSNYNNNNSFNRSSTLQSSSNSTSLSSSKSSSKYNDDDMGLEDVEFDDDDTSTTTSNMSSMNISSANKFTPSSSNNNNNNTITPSSSSPLTFSTSALPLSTATQLQKLIFGTNLPSFNTNWLQQGLFFHDKGDNRWGLVQYKGGPCGILASLQANVLKELLFSGSATTAAARLALLATTPPLMQLLINAMCNMLWCAGDEQQAVVCTATSKPPQPRRIGDLLPDGIVENLMVTAFHNKASLQQFITHNISLFTAPRGAGTVLFLYSLVLSRGLDNVRTDMDDGSCSMVGGHGYCTQELVNLCMVGRAFSNVFDGVKHIDSSQFKGIMQRSSIGFLSLFEHYGHVLVGNHYKSPTTPIWVICSESHYSVLFSTAIPSTPVFDVFYYDELANQLESIKLTVDISQKSDAPRSDDLEPPLNECIRTKWGKNARVDWNGSEPIL